MPSTKPKPTSRTGQRAPHASRPARAPRPVGRTAEVTAAPQWRAIAALVLSLGGLGVSTYLTITHFDQALLVCSSTGIVNCAHVTTSAQSYVFGIPVAILGLAFYVAMTAINLPFLWRVADPRVHIARLAMAVVGMGFVLYLVAAELLIIRNICLWCTSVHVVTFLLFVLMLTTIPSMLGWGTAGGRAR